ncbi:hypothetical protein [Gemmatimonas sp.]|jgi:hypothetical protein|uniref:hypothetical protein n=1 Tax=Gemmatimonas sp. TaxID=1962908 RepID=UPI0037BEED12
MMRTPVHLRYTLAITAALLTGGSSVDAQGSLGALGFGYPVNGVSTRTAGTVGALAEFDALTPINPSSIGGISRTVLSVQTEPEYRTLTIGGVREKTASQRVPLLMVVLPARHGVAVSFSARGFLDRSYTTSTTGSAVLDGATVPTTDKLEMRGAIGDLRGAVGWQIVPRVRVGLGGHIFTGEHQATRQRSFADTLLFGGTLDTSKVTYFGTALSFGGEAQLIKGLAVALSYRMGNDFDARIRDTTRATGAVPARLGAAVRYDGIPGAVFSVGYEQVRWSDMQPMASSRTTASDAANYFGGAEIAGPRVRGYPMMLRVGYARNALPFSNSAQVVQESRLGGGVGMPIARDAASIDFSLQRANRSLAGTTATERAWLLGLGVQIRP